MPKDSCVLAHQAAHYGTIKGSSIVGARELLSGPWGCKEARGPTGELPLAPYARAKVAAGPLHSAPSLSRLAWARRGGRGQCKDNPAKNRPGQQVRGRLQRQDNPIAREPTPPVFRMVGPTDRDLGLGAGHGRRQRRDPWHAPTNIPIPVPSFRGTGRDKVATAPATPSYPEG